MERYDLFIVGGGAAGISSAVAASKKGKKVLLADENQTLGGILNQCVHNGFGLSYFKEDLTGTEYARKLISLLKTTDAEILTETTVLKISKDKSALLSNKNGISEVYFDNLILATGCLEKTIGTLPLSGTHPSGIFTAGEVQKMINTDHKPFGDNIVILGSGDIGQIMARHFSMMGKNVIAVIEKEDHLGGLKRNHERCIKAHNIPVIFNSTLCEICGEKALTGIWIKNTKNNEKLFIPCENLVTAIGLTPDKSLLDDFEAIPSWISLIGNCSYVHEIVDAVTMHAEETINNLYK